MAYDPSKCAMCFIPFVKGPGGFNRTRLATFTTPAIAAEFCQRTVYLDNFVCKKCQSVILRNTVKPKRKRGKRCFLISSRPRKRAHAASAVKIGESLDLDLHRKGGQKEEDTLKSPTPKAMRRALSDIAPQMIHVQEVNHEKDETVDGQTKSTGRGSVERGDEEVKAERRGGQESQNSNLAPQSHLEKALDLLADYKYLPGIRALCKVSPKAKQSVITAVTEMIGKEIHAKPKIKSFQQEVSQKTVASFSFEAAWEEAQQSVPATVSCIEAMLQLKKSIKRVKENKSDLVRKACYMLSTALNSRCRLNNFLPACVGMAMLKERVKHKAYTVLNRAGISQCKSSVMLGVDTIGKEHERKLMKWKESQEKPKAKPKAKGKTKHQGPESYGFCSEKIRVGPEGKNQMPGHSNTVELRTMCLAVEDRITGKTSRVQVPAVELDPYTFLPSPDVFERQRSRAIFLVKHLITKHLTKLQPLRSKLPSRIHHAHIKKMDEKSQCVSLGVIDADPSTTQGMATVMEHLQKYVPVTQDQPTPCLLSGDGLSVECILDAQKSRSNEAKWDDRLEAFYACPQEFHKELLHLKDSNDKFFKASSLANRGTFAQLKSTFSDYRSFKIDSIENVQLLWDLYKLVTESHIIMCAMKLCGLTSLDGEPEGLPSTGKVAGQLQWLTNLAQRVVDFCWAPPDRGDVQVAAAAFDEKLHDVPEEALRYCLCNTDEISDEMIRCRSRTCRHALFHLCCVGLDKAPDPDEDWFCSQVCERSNSYIYCFCHTRGPDGEDMVQCHLAEHCRKYEWYHKSCVDIDKDNPIPEKWYCCEECALGSENDDYALNHTKALMYEGLCHLIRRQAVQDGNGPAMVDDWKADMVRFHERDHPQYLINGHYFLACVGGFAHPKLQVSYMWNRVANPKGEPGGNVGLDLMNLGYSGTIASSGKTAGNTLRYLSRCAQLSGPFGRDLEAMLVDSDGADVGEPKRSLRTELHDQEIQRFTEEYQADALFDYIPGRQHSAFGEFESSCQVHNPKEFGQMLHSLSTTLDMVKNSTSSCEEEQMLPRDEPYVV